MDDTVTFKVGAIGMALRPGDLVKVMDPDKGGVRFGGRVVAQDGDTITLDAAPPTPLAGRGQPAPGGTAHGRAGHPEADRGPAPRRHRDEADRGPAPGAPGGGAAEGRVVGPGRGLPDRRAVGPLPTPAGAPRVGDEAVRWGVGPGRSRHQGQQEQQEPHAASCMAA
ncbi:host specificity protein J [Cyanophage S-2L]|nr:host specificity protein J [Cyanophage S-2L]